jgi:hypothetical protein
MEGGGLNRIPGAFAELLAERLGVQVETSAKEDSLSAR